MSNGLLSELLLENEVLEVASGLFRSKGLFYELLAESILFGHH